MAEPRELPKKPQLSVQEVAEELGCTEADVRYYLNEGLIRYGFSSRGINNRAVVSVSDLDRKQVESAELFKPIETHIYDAPDFDDRVDSQNVLPLPEYIYLKPSENLNLKSLAIDEYKGELYTFNFEMFTGTHVFLLMKLPMKEPAYLIRGVDIGALRRYDDGIWALEPAVITREELDRFKEQMRFCIVSLMYVGRY